MRQVFFREMRANWKSLFFWSLSLLALASIGFVEFAGIKNATDSIDFIFNMMPRIVRVMFGFSSLPIFSAQGYYVCLYLWICFLTYTHAALLGATLLSKEERDQTADFLFSMPVRRDVVITGKLLAGAVNVIILGLVTWVSTLIFFLPQIEGIQFTSEINLTMIGMIITQLVMLCAGMCCAACARSYKKATHYAMAYVVVSYFLYVFIEMVGTISFMNFITPFRFFYAEGMLQNKLQPLYLCISVLMVCATGAVTYRCYKKRDLHH